MTINRLYYNIDKYIANKINPPIKKIGEIKHDLSPTKVVGFTLKKFYGQEAAVDILSVAIGAAKKQKKPLDHILFYGGPGLGKSLLARTMACEMNSYYKEFLGSELRESSSIKDLLNFLLLPYPNKAIFIDEVHSISLKSAEMLYEAMQDFSIKGEKIVPFTLMAATTYSGKIYRPLRERFTYAIKLELYNKESICKLLKDKFPKLPDNVIEFIADRSKSIPRIGLHYAKKIIDTAIAEGKEVGIRQATFIMNVLKVNDDGLTQDDISVLSVLKENKGPMSRNNICSVLNIDSSDFDWLIEPILLNLGFITIMPRGRCILDAGRLYLARLEKAGLCELKMFLKH